MLTNNLNQYIMLSVDDITDFIPEYDADGNQTRVKTSTGIWAICYNAENRPTDFTKVDSSGSTTIHCEYDYIGRRATKQVSVNGNVTLHQRYLYRGYLQIASLNLTRSNHPALWFITWDPTQPIATRPLSIRINGTWYTYGWDLTKNICELYSTGGSIASSYTYTPFGKVTSSGNVTQPIQWSSEVFDVELSMVYYNYRYYNTIIGRWMKRDLVYKHNLYSYIHEQLLFKVDILGLEDTPKTLKEKTYDYAIKYKIQLKDEQRIYKATDCCSEQNWLLFVAHTDEAMQFLSGNYRDEFGSINMDIFDMIAIVSCAPDLTNSLVPEKKTNRGINERLFSVSSFSS